MAQSENVFGKTVVTPKGVMFFLDLDTPNTQEKHPQNKFPSNKFDITVGIPKKTDISELKAEVDKVAQEAFGTTDVDTPFANGDEKSMSSMKGYIIVRAKSSKRPGLIDGDKQRITEAECSAGMWARVAVTPMSYISGRNKGVTFVLKHVQVLTNLEYESLGGGSDNPEDLFD